MKSGPKLLDACRDVLLAIADDPMLVMPAALAIGLSLLAVIVLAFV